jgi:amidase
MRGGHSWVGASAARIAAAVQRGDASATEVIVDHLDHARLADRVLDLLGVLRAGAAVAEAEQVDAADQGLESEFPLVGVPVIVAEDTPVAGVATSRHAVAPEDHEIVRRLRGAGAVVLGTGRQAGDDAGRRGRHRPGKHEDNGGRWRGPMTRNPWRGDRSPGGASVGPAAAVAAGVVPLAHATSGVAISAASCGLVGLIPGLDTNAVYSDERCEEHGIIATTVADAAVGQAVVAGRWPELLPGGRRLRVAASVRCPIPLVGADRATRTAVRRAARLLIGLDHDVVAAEPNYSTWLALAARRRNVRAGQRIDWRAHCEHWFRRGGFDLLLQPAVAGPPPAVVPNSGDWLGSPFASARLTAYTVLWSLAGLPTMTVPMGLRPDGLPASVQLIGPPGSESLLCAVAAQLEWIAPWRRHAPGWPRPVRPFGLLVARSGHDRKPASNEAGDPGRRRGGQEGTRRRGPDDAAGAEPPADGGTGRTRVAQM